ncbi:MAG: aspartate dehydrogenase [Clostridiaceae bacterium]|nr:aspartate dehydrogenase [Clostridiaceae bacterium]
MKKIAVIGYGALGKIFVDAMKRILPDVYEVEGIFVRNREKVEKSLEELGIRVYQSFDELLCADVEYVVEIASVQAVADYGVRILESGKNLIVTSVGALADEKLWNDLEDMAEKTDRKVLIVSGAIGGFDLLRTFQLMGNNRARIENYKAPESLKGAPYLEQNPLSETERSRIFTGNAREAIAGFPKNVNVAVASALASVGTEAMEVEITSCPGEKNNIHRITTENDLGKAVIEIMSRPDPENPKSSIMTAWSVVALLENLASRIQFF